MDSKKIRTSISRYAGWLGLNFCSFVIKLIPPACLYSFSRGLGKIGFRIASKQRRIALESLKMAFAGALSEKEIKETAKDCFITMAKSGVELMYLLDKPGILKSSVSFENKEYLDNALKKGNGAILVSAHFGNFPLLLARLALEGYKSGGIMRAMRDERVEKAFIKKRQRYGVKTIYSQPRNTCVSETITALRNNEIVFIPIDQNFGTGGVFVDFFGAKAATATGPVVLAQRTGAALLPCFIVRQDDDTHRIIFEPQMELAEGVNADDTVRINIQNLTAVIEAYIRKYPAQWGWIHRRWKSKPSSGKSLGLIVDRL